MFFVVICFSFSHSVFYFFHKLGCSTALEPATRLSWIATAFGTYKDDPAYGPSKAIDGSNNTFYHPTQVTQVEDHRSNWLQIDFGMEISVNRVQLTFRQDGLFPERDAFVEVRREH